MTDVLQALYEFWSQFGIPAYLSDQVPAKAEYPYITYTADVGDLCGATTLTAFNWHTDNEERRLLCDAIARAVPVGGVVLHVGNGYIHLFRNSAGFQSVYVDTDGYNATEQRKNVIAGRTSVEAYFYLT